MRTILRNRNWLATSYWLLIWALLSAAAFFAISAEQGRRDRRPKVDGIVESGTEVVAVEVIDGDELVVRSDAQVFVVRLLGIKAFDAKANDPVVSGLGAAARQALSTATTGPLHVVYEEPRKDKAGRLLAYVHAADGDVGARLIAQGHALAYVRYPFSREPSYLAAEGAARAKAAGLWSNPKAVVRATALGATWRAQRDDD